MTTGKSDIVDVTLEPRIKKEKAQAFWMGELDKDDKEIWIWLPLSQIEINQIQDSPLVEVSLPEWLAIEKELV